MAAGLPYISKDVGCVKNMGTRIIVHTVREAVQAIQQIIYDKEFRNQGVNFNKSKVKNDYEINKVLKHFEKSFMEILDL